MSNTRPTHQENSMRLALLLVASAFVFEPVVVPSAPWQTLHLSLETICRRGFSAPDSATSAKV